ncbi:hypothetical protein DACRYDRAFT_111555 [Dacryopinax primogenitus]|uniref:Uncharacterized protein n=1 Tax=Dacryopinax primogenitus (strain DJM 731) TaxID=1858805 RepID=M5FQ36_DACPD|nr:uncharacterized protein DACRYDRAFT_111555 [Dacryopinax primogenitus]EJT97508.1 hypothetical protein DACRYDRAFT_111555 [Dacryopinax primogenitus]
MPRVWKCSVLEEWRRDIEKCLGVRRNVGNDDDVVVLGERIHIILTKVMFSDEGNPRTKAIDPSQEPRSHMHVVFPEKLLDGPTDMDVRSRQTSRVVFADLISAASRHAGTKVPTPVQVVNPFSRKMSPKRETAKVALGRCDIYVESRGVLHRGSAVLPAGGCLGLVGENQ